MSAWTPVTPTGASWTPQAPASGSWSAGAAEQDHDWFNLSKVFYVDAIARALTLAGGSLLVVG